jgi:hypothetical protein
MKKEISSLLINIIQLNMLIIIPQRYNLGKIALINFLELTVSSSLKIVGAITTEKNNRLPKSAKKTSFENKVINE